jgi:hypothetical protein
MKFKRLAAGSIVAATFLIGSAGVAHAAQPDKVIGFGKSTDGTCAVIFLSSTGHWSADFNPSDANAFIHQDTCTGKTTVIVSGQLLQP